MAETAPDITRLGVSILAPGVQEMAKGPPTSVPPRYVREDDGVASTDPPVIDFGKLLLGDDADVRAAKVRWCFFQLINHGVSAALIEDAKESIQQLLNLPTEEESNYWQEPGDVEGFGQAFVVSDEQKLDGSDMYYMIMLPKPLRNPKLFPKLPPPIR